MGFAVGALVRMVQTSSCGQVVGHSVGSDGGARTYVKWTNTGTVTSWSAGFLRPAGTCPDDDPDKVQVGDVFRQRGTCRRDLHGNWITKEEGFFRE